MNKKNPLKDINVILEHCDSKEKMIIQEGFWIKELQANKQGYGYNISDGYWGGDTFTNNPNKDEIQKNRIGQWTGDKNPNFGKLMSQEIKDKISKTKTGKPIHSEDNKKKMSIRIKKEFKDGKRPLHLTQEIKDKISKTKTGQLLSEEQKTKIGDGVKNSEKYKLNYKLYLEKRKENPLIIPRLLKFLELIKENKNRLDIMSIMNIKESTYYKYKR
jgi:hypothetical protein